MSRKITQSDFINRANIVHNFKYDYSSTNYTLSKNKIIVKCPIHGEFSIRASHHLSGIGCKKCSFSQLKKSQTEFIEEALKVHGNKYDYSITVYSGARDMVSIICPIHGKFEQMASSHIRGFGCKKCGHDLITDTTKQFIEKAVKIHNDKYDYSLVNYKSNVDKISIKCNQCGQIFLQTPNSHISGHGCMNCRGVSTFTRTGWITHCNSQNKIPLLYIIRCYNNNEEFIKIGRTSRSIHERFWSGMPYSYEVIREIKGSPDFIFDKEHELHRKYKMYKYIPIISFFGKTECFNISILQDILKH